MFFCHVSESSNSQGSFPTSRPVSTSSSPPSSTTSSPVKSPVKSELKTLSLKNTANQENINTDSKPKRWKKCKLSEQDVSKVDNKALKSGEESQSSVTDSIVKTQPVTNNESQLNKDNLTESKVKGLKSQESMVVPATKRRVSNEEPSSTRYVFLSPLTLELILRRHLLSYGNS